VMAVGNAVLVSVVSGRMRGPAARDLAAALRRMHLRLVGSVLLTDRSRRA
jgi:hypothetical protein